MLLKSSCRSSRRDWPTVLVVSLGSPVGAGAKRKPSLARRLNVASSFLLRSSELSASFSASSKRESSVCANFCSPHTKAGLQRSVAAERRERPINFVLPFVDRGQRFIYGRFRLEISSLSAFPVGSLGVYACEKIAFRLGDDVQDMPS